MAYKDIILSDYPIAYLRSNNVSGTGLGNYQEIINTFSTYTQLSNNIEAYSSLVGNTIVDQSPCSNNASYLGDIQTNLMPIVPGESYGMKIDVDSYIVLATSNDYQGTVTNGSAFGTRYNSDNDFTLSLWFRPKISSTGVIPILADTANNIGIYYEKGNIVFKLQNEKIEYTLPFLDRSFYIVATYNQATFNLYIDGDLKAYKSLSGFTFTNSVLNLQCGPTASNEYFLTNGIALYRYAISSAQIQNHMAYSVGIPGSQVVTPDGGRLFELHDTNKDAVFNFTYPNNKNWSYLVVDGLSYDSNLNTLYMTKTDTAVGAVVETTDFIFLPNNPAMDSSKIEWSGDNGVEIYTSLDGINYTQCTNNAPIPGYTLSSFSSSRTLYIKFVFTSTDTSRFIPKLEYLFIKFYSNQTEDAINSSDYFSTMEGVVGPSSYDATMGNNLFPMLIRDARNGVRVSTGAGFYINALTGVKTLEFFYTPYSLNAGGLIVIEGGDYFKWSNSGVISDSGISWIYVNGVDKTTATNISSLFEVGETYHVMIGLANTVSGQIEFNHTTTGAVAGRYQNIALYESALAQSKVQEHYNLYTGNNTYVVNAASFAMTESSADYYNIDWTVVQNS